MHDRGMVTIGLGAFLFVVTSPFWLARATGTRSERPDLPFPPGIESCIEATEFMRHKHMKLIDGWRDEVVRKGKREYTAADGTKYEMSLTRTCLGCHSNKQAFCDRCHDYVSVDLVCWDCHVVPGGG